jgi:hypothetical protein
MTNKDRLSQSEAKDYYAKKISEMFNVSQERSEELAEELITQLIAHGDNPYVINGVEKNIKIVVGKWILKK